MNKDSHWQGALAPGAAVAVRVPVAGGGGYNDAVGARRHCPGPSVCEK